MAQEVNKPLIDLERRSPNYPLALLGGFVFFCLAAAVVMAVTSAVWTIFVLVVFAVIGAAAFAYFNAVRKAAGAKNWLDWEPTVTEVQKQSLGLEVDGIADTLELDPWQKNDLFSAYIVAEDLALRQIQQEHNAPMIRHAQVGKMPFDALVIKRDVVTCVEVSFLVSPRLRQEKIASMLKKASVLKRFVTAEKLDASVRLLVVLVTQLTPKDDELLRSELGKDRFADTAVDIDIRLLDFEELQRTYLGN